MDYLATMPAVSPPGVSLLSPEEWAAIKVSSLRGVTDDELARQFGVTTASIRKRRQRDPIWAAACPGQPFGKGIVPKRHSIEKVSQESVTKASFSAQTAEKVSQTITTSLAEKGEQCRLRLLDLAAKGIESAHKANLAVESWQDAKIVTEIAAKAGNWASEQQTTAVQVLFTGSEAHREVHAVPPESDAIDVDCETIDAE